MNKKTVPMWELEEAAQAQGFALVCGCDEAGAGPLAGPVYAAAVILPPDLVLAGLNDSKQVTAKRREALFDQIQQGALAWAVAWAGPEEIDETDILSARMLAMQRAIDGLDPAADYALIDGNRDKGRHFAITVPHETVIKGDSRSVSIAAASILAKVSRDRYVSQELNALYPQYGFAKHKGYGTKAHYAALDQYGPCPAHRRTFLKKWEARRP